MELYFLVGAMFAIALVLLFGKGQMLSMDTLPKAFVLAMTVAACWPGVILLALAWQYPAARDWITRFVFTGKIR